MSCVNECACPKTTCPNHRKCCACVVKHRDTDSLPFCLFPDNNGDKSVANYFGKLRERFERVGMICGNDIQNSRTTWETTAAAS